MTRPTVGDWRGTVALVLAVGATVAVVTLAVGAVLQATPITPQGSALLTGALGAIIGAVAVFLGGHVLPPEVTQRGLSHSPGNRIRESDTDDDAEGEEGP
jgi:Mn2+/Fe2+ NRAMP family transporter